MNLFRIFKKQSRQTGDVPTPSSTTSSPPVVTSSNPAIEVLVQGADPITADIVFVHGLGGHLRNTWTKDNVCWPQDLLSKEEALSHIRVLTFGYDANIVDLNGRASLNTLFEHSINLVQELSRVRRKDAHDRPIIFIAHSLGGLIVKDALHFSNRVHDTYPHLAQIFSFTRGIIFLGTPHRGSGKTSIAKVVASVAQMALQNPPLDLERDPQTLDRIGDSFVRILDKRTLKVWSFAEELAITGVGKLVPAGSAIIGHPCENRDTIYDDHFSMAKFSTRDDPGYKKVVNSIEILLEGLGEGSLTPSKVKSDAVGLQEAKTFYVIPPLRVPYFIRREALCARLRALFDRATTASAPSIVVLIGMGGVGKTQLALEYCLRRKDSRIFRAIFWLDASSQHALYSSMGTAARHLLPDRVFDDPDAAVALVKEVLSSWSEPWLLVFDGLDNPEDLSGILSFFPPSHCGSILVTSRLAASKMLGQSIGLDCMEREEGLQLLLGSSGGDTDEVDAAEEILSLLGNLPLAIDQAQSYISKRRLGLRAFVTEYERRKQSVMQETPQFWSYRRMLAGKEVSLNLFTTWEMSLQLLGVGEQAAELEKVITLFAFFNPVNIGERLFNNDADDGNPKTSPMSIFKEDGHWNHPKFEDAVVKMTELSLLQFSHCNESEITVSLHSMVSEWLRMRLDKSSQSTFLNTAISHLQSYLGSIGYGDHKTRQEAQAHVDTIWRGVKGFGLDDHILEACITFGNFYRDQGRLKDAEMVYNRALAGYERMLGPEHPTTLSTINNLGLLFNDQGRYQDAEMMYDRALAGYEKAFGPEHPSTVSAVNNLGLLYSNQGRLEDAEIMYVRALAGREKALGPDHPTTLSTVNNLGLLYTDQGHYKDAEIMYDRALAGREKALRPEHTSSLDAHATLASGLPMSSNACLNAAVDVMDRLVENKGGIEALFRNIGINHKDLAIAAGFDEEAFASSGMLIQQPYILTCVDLSVDEDIIHLLDALGKLLSPYSGVVSTPSRKYYFPAYPTSSGISSHGDPSGVSQESPVKERGRDGNQQGNDRKQTGEGSSDHEAERESPHSDPALGGNDGDAEGNHNLQSVETNNSEVEQMSSVRHVALGFPPNDGPPGTSKPGHNVYFQVKFNIKHVCMPNQKIIVEGTVQSEEIPHAAPHVNLSTRIQFLGLDFNNNLKTGYRQSSVVVKIDVGKDQGRFRHFDANPQSTPRQDSKMKQVESTERTGQHQMGISTNFTLPPFKPTLGGSYNYTTLRKSGTTKESSVNLNGISLFRTDQDLNWCFTVDDEHFQDYGVRNLTPSASFSFFGAEKKPEKLKIEVKSIWTMPDSGVWNIYTRFTNTVPLRNLATQVAFDIPPHMNKSWIVFRDLAVTMIPRDKGFGVKMQVESNEVYGDIDSQDFHAFIT